MKELRMQAPPSLTQSRKLLVSQVHNIDYSGAFMNINYDHSKTSEDFLKSIKITINRMDENELEFEIVGIDASIANALRRIMIAEIPTMAIEKINLYQNTSVIHDEVLVHRIGLVPIKADPSLFLFKKEEDEIDESNTIKLRLKAKCERKEKYKGADRKLIDSLPLEEVYTNTTVYASQFNWEPLGGQAKTFEKTPVKAVHDKIIIAKLRENQEIDAELLCEKGTGKTHAKWSPVSTAYYRLMPHIEFKSEIRGENVSNSLHT
eukprot:TRINITY_DN1010_c0_g1_i7.p1 TRINITY_DN1010_c0_g1~~TRINITY_DN1010_c0_g1_i7.p1  ORF type:complete len:263 (-),score=63.64 TRINITY_DN1010_c0_g1_i7:645-1433(-)